MPTAGELEAALYELAPRELAQSWDNVGLLVGDPDQQVDSVLIALDITQAVVDEAAAKGCGAMDRPQGKLIATLLRSGISAICMHTNLDSAPGGVNDALAAALGLREVAPLGEDGIGRVGVLEKEMSLAAFAAFVQGSLSAGGVRYADGDRPVYRVAVGGGACGEYAALARDLGCDTFVTADLKYHDFQNAPGLGLNLLDAGHYPTENVVCAVLEAFLRSRFPDMTVIRSSVHGDIIQYQI